MIDELVVRNLGVIREARIEFGPGLTVLTGETGAGKTLLLGALRMLLGADARPTWSARSGTKPASKVA
jgi:DNA repair protein RecN (Recombination protein N)